jgi:hypothetical protein
MIGRRMANIIKCLARHRDDMRLANFQSVRGLDPKWKLLRCPIEYCLPNLTPLWANRNLGLTVPTLFPVASSSARSSSGKGPSIASFSSGTVATTRGQFKCGSSVTTQTHTCQRRPLVRRSRCAGTCLRLGWGCIRRSDRLITDRKER